MREQILKNPKARELLPNLMRLAEGGISFHTQWCSVPGDDGRVLLPPSTTCCPTATACSRSPLFRRLTAHANGFLDELPHDRVQPSTARDGRALPESVASRTTHQDQLSDDIYLKAGRRFPMRRATATSDS